MEYLDKLTSFVAGKTSTDEMEEALYERLSELRETPEVNEEQELLSALELALEELREGRCLPEDALARAREVQEALMGGVRELGCFEAVSMSVGTSEVKELSIRPTQTFILHLGPVGVGR